MMGKLYVVPTPIGNLKDITLRALEVLKEVSHIACEDTRRTKILLDNYEIYGKNIRSYFAPREEEKIPYMLELLKTDDVALVVDSGMPGISDPGWRLIRACVEQNIKVEVLPGSTAFITALVGSGLPTDRFLFLGFVPKKGKIGYFNQLKTLRDVTVIMYESPFRVRRTLLVISEIFGDVPVVLAREISKIYEEYLRGTTSELLTLVQDKTLKGEIVLLFRLNKT